MKTRPWHKGNANAIWLLAFVIAVWNSFSHEFTTKKKIFICELLQMKILDHKMCTLQILRMPFVGFSIVMCMCARFHIFFVFLFVFISKRYSCSDCGEHHNFFTPIIFSVYVFGLCSYIIDYEKCIAWLQPETLAFIYAIICLNVYISLYMVDKYQTLESYTPKRLKEKFFFSRSIVVWWTYI